MPKIPHSLVHSTDTEGRQIVGVRLTNSREPAWLDRADYERIVANFGTPTWRLTTNGQGRLYVRFKQPGRNSRNVTVARLVAGDFERTGVRYRDGDPLNLRSRNLYHDDGGGRCPKTLRRSSASATFVTAARCPTEHAGSGSPSRTGP